ncbi:hypothetical protein DdX_12803 [Ditylenchus destructor]|uniref:F-box domain-containing protein n=1 Tax=Ditylenchus destructor TaxID=166010 RepID=A0AAD4R3D5_9BILA|nr:hypothetical protein DdX_12803 [Ditylenchus destructor]
MSIPPLLLGLQLDIFALFHRSELSRISETSRRVNAIISKHFASSPRLIFDYLHYENGVWKWSDVVDLNESEDELGAAATLMSDNQIAQLATSKFLRFKLSIFNFDDGNGIKFYYFMNFVFKTRNPVPWIMNSIFKRRSSIEVLKVGLMVYCFAHKHLWEGSRLRIVAVGFWCSTELTSIVNTSHNLALMVPGAVDMLPQLFCGNTKHIAVGDLDFTPDSSENIVVITMVAFILNYTKKLSLDDISNFLLHNSCGNHQCGPFNLRICTNYMPKYCQEMVDSIKQKFLETRDPSEFRLDLIGTMNWPEAHDWTLDHPHKNKELRFKISDLYFSLKCSVSE